MYTKKPRSFRSAQVRSEPMRDAVPAGMRHNGKGVHRLRFATLGMTLEETLRS